VPWDGGFGCGVERRWVRGGKESGGFGAREESHCCREVAAKGECRSM